MIFSESQLNYTIRASVNVIGQDLLIVLTGGDVPHIGTVTTLTRTIPMETVCFPSHNGRNHKDDILARKIAQLIQQDLPGSCVITSGVHVDHISKAQIAAASSMANNLGKQILAWLQKNQFQSKQPHYYGEEEKLQ